MEKWHFYPIEVHLKVQCVDAQITYLLERMQLKFANFQILTAERHLASVFVNKIADSKSSPQKIV